MEIFLTSEKIIASEAWSGSDVLGKESPQCCAHEAEGRLTIVRSIRWKVELGRQNRADENEAKVDKEGIWKLTVGHGKSKVKSQGGKT